MQGRLDNEDALGVVGINRPHLTRGLRYFSDLQFPIVSPTCLAE